MGGAPELVRLLHPTLFLLLPLGDFGGDSYEAEKKILTSRLSTATLFLILDGSLGAFLSSG